MDDVEDDIHTSLNQVDHHKPKKLDVGDAIMSSAETHRHPHWERRIAVSSVETRGLSVTQSEAGMPGVEAVAGVRSVSLLHSLPLSEDLDQGRRLHNGQLWHSRRIGNFLKAGDGCQICLVEGINFPFFA